MTDNHLIISADAVVSPYYVQDDGNVPNSKLPVLVYRNVLGIKGGGGRLHSEIKQILGSYVSQFGWCVDWVNANAVFRYTHYHSTAYEVLYVLERAAKLRIGGRRGIDIEVQRCDAIAIPPGVAHRRVAGDQYFTAAGLYPVGQKWDMLRPTNPGDYQTARDNIPNVPLPKADPFYGPNGPMMKCWNPKS